MKAEIRGAKSLSLDYPGPTFWRVSYKPRSTSDFTPTKYDAEAEEKPAG